MATKIAHIIYFKEIYTKYLKGIFNCMITIVISIKKNLYMYVCMNMYLCKDIFYNVCRVSLFPYVQMHTDNPQ